MTLFSKAYLGLWVKNKKITSLPLNYGSMCNTYALYTKMNMSNTQVVCISILSYTIDNYDDIHTQYRLPANHFLYVNIPYNTHKASLLMGC